MKAIVEIDVPEWQIGRDVSVYFPDTMVAHGTCNSNDEITKILDQNNKYKQMVNEILRAQVEDYNQYKWTSEYGYVFKVNDLINIISKYKEKEE